MGKDFLEIAHSICTEEILYGGLPHFLQTVVIFQPRCLLLICCISEFFDYSFRLNMDNSMFGET